VKELIGHKTIPLSKRTAELGLSIDDEDIKVFKLLDASNSVITARYLEVGYYSRASIEALERTCNSLRKSITYQMRKAGMPIRALPSNGRISAKNAKT